MTDATDETRVDDDPKVADHAAAEQDPADVEPTRLDVADYGAAAAAGMVVAHWAHVQPDVPAVLSAHGDRTYAQLNAAANRLVRAWRRRGVEPGDAVALLVANRPEFAEVIAASQRAGQRLTAINWHLTADEAAYIVGDCQAKVLVADARFASVAVEAARRAPNTTVRLAVGGEIDGFEPYDEAVVAEDGDDIGDPTIGTSMLYTSGTTGRPKGVHRSEIPPSRGIGALFGYTAGESVHLCTGPLYHAAPLAFSLSIPISAGATVALMDRWTPEETLDLIGRHRVTHSHLVPTMFHRLLRLPDDVRAKADVSSLRHVLHGAAPCPVPVKRAMIEWWGPVITEYYASTEGTGTFVGSEEWLAHPGTVGKPPTPDHVRILDPVSGDELPPGEVGTVYLKAPSVGRFDYFGDPEKTAASYQGDHFTMGDVGYLDEDGYLYLTDRSADLIISGGVNVYPAEVEAALLTHPDVGDAAVIGVPDPDWGEIVVAVVEPGEGVTPSAELGAALVEHCRGSLAHFKCPRRVDFTEALPRADSGKLVKRRLRDEYRAATEASDRPPPSP